METFLYNKNGDFIEVKKTGRYARKTAGTRIQREELYVEIEPVIVDQEIGKWTIWTTEDQLYFITK